MTGTTHRRSFYGWTLLAALSLAALINHGITHFGAPVINSYMAQALDLDRTRLGLLFSAYMLAMGAGSLLLTPLEARFGVKGTLVIGCLLLLGGAGAMATVVAGITGAALAYGVAMGLAVMVGAQLPAQACLANWFVRRRALAFSLLWCISGIGGAIAPPLMDAIIRATGNWRAAWMVLAALALLSTALVLIFVRMSPAAMGQHPDGVADPQGTVAASGGHGHGHGGGGGPDWPLRLALRSPVLWLLFVAELGPTVGFHMLLAHGFPHLKDLGYSATTAAGALSVVTVAYILGNLLIGVLGDRIETRKIWLAISLLFAIGTVLIIRPTAPWQLYGAAFCLGAGFGGSVVAMMTVLANYFGATALLSISGLAVATQMLVGAAAPALAGFAYDRYHSYGPAFAFAAALSVLGAMILGLIRRPAYPGGG